MKTQFTLKQLLLASPCVAEAIRLFRHIGIAEETLTVLKMHFSCTIPLLTEKGMRQFFTDEELKTVITPATIIEAVLSAHLPDGRRIACQEARMFSNLNWCAAKKLLQFPLCKAHKEAAPLEMHTSFMALYAARFTANDEYFEKTVKGARMILEDYSDEKKEIIEGVIFSIREAPREHLFPEPFTFLENMVQ